MNYDSQIDEDLFKKASEEVKKELGEEDIMEDLDYTMASVVRKKVEEQVQEELQKRVQEEVQKKVQEELQKNQREMTLKLLKTDMSVEKVSEITGLLKQEICKLQEKAEK